MTSTKASINDLVIIGGGITGLSAAYMAAKEGKKVTLIEASATFGGLLNTFEIGQHKLEYYYHHFFIHDQELIWLIQELKLSHQLSFEETSMGVLNNGKIYPFNTFLDLLKFKPIRFIDKIRFGFTSLFLGKIARWRKFENVACMSWFEKWAGSSTTKSLWAPLLKIKFGPYAAAVPLSWMIGRLRQRMNSRKSGTEKLGYLKGSLDVLLEALVIRLKALNVDLICNAAVEKVCIENNKVQSVITAQGEFKGHDFLFTIPGIYLSPLIRKHLPALANQLDTIKYFGAVCVVLELDRPLSNIYWLNIADPGYPFGGIIEHTNFIHPSKYNGSHIVYLSRYFAKEEAFASLSELEIKELMVAHLPNIYSAFKSDWIKNAFVFRTNTAATVCDLEFSKKIPSCKTEISNLYIANMSHVYPDERSTNNSIRVAAEACRLMGINTDSVPKNNSLSGKIGF